MNNDSHEHENNNNGMDVENHQHAATNSVADAPTQTQLYDDLRRIFQLEDEKARIQNEIDDRTDRLRTALPHLDASSLMYQMLSAAIGKTPKAKSAAASPKSVATTPAATKPNRKKAAAKKKATKAKAAKSAKAAE